MPPGLRAITRKATQSEPEHRFQTAAEMLAALDERGQAGWGAGAPVQQGDRLNDSYQVDVLHGEVEGVSAFDGSEIATGETFTIGLADSTGGARLLQAFKESPPAVRRALGYRGLQQTIDKLHFVILVPGEPLERVRSFLAAHPLPAAASVGVGAGRPETSRVALPPGAPPYLRGFYSFLETLDTLDPTAAVLSLAERARWLLLIVCAQLERGEANSETLNRWREHVGASLGRLVRSVEPSLDDARGTGQFRKPLVSGLLKLTEVRNQVAHGQFQERRPPVASFLPAFQSLLDLTVLLAQGSPPASLAPFVQELDEGRWGLLSNRSGTMRIRYVDLEQGMLVAAPPEVDARIGEWLDAKLEPAFGGVVVREDGKLLLRESAGYPQYPQKLWSLAKGRPRVGETPQETAIRSVREESGAEARVVARIPGTFPGTTTENAYFLMELVKDHETFNTKETRSVRWVEFDEAEALVRSGDGARAWERNLAVLAAARRLYASLHSTRRPESP